jgi:hypothetical protein
MPVVSRGIRSSKYRLSTLRAVELHAASARLYGAPFAHAALPGSTTMPRFFLILLALVSLTPPAFAAESTFQISPRLGRGEMRIAEFQGISNRREEISALNMGGTVGFTTPIGVVLEAGIGMQSNFDWWSAVDDYTLSQQYLAVGYQIDFAKGWRFVPKAGRARWKLQSEEGMFLNPGPEATKVIRGYEHFWEAQLSRRISDVVSLGAAYQEGEFDFGRARSISFVATFGF